MAECSVDPKIERFAFEVPGAEQGGSKGCAERLP